MAPTHAQSPQHQQQPQQPLQPVHPNPHVPLQQQQQQQHLQGEQPEAFDWGEMGEVAKQYPMAQMGLQMGNLFVQKRMAGIMSWLRFHSLRPYFHVNNNYVRRKLQVLAMPFLVKDFLRSRHRVPATSPEVADAQGQMSAFKSPVQDLNAPDLYIPLMAIITYILLLGFSHAQVDQFSPEVLGVTASSAFLLLSLEVGIIKVGFWLIGEDCPSYLDLLALLAYRFVGLIVTVIAGLLAGGWATLLMFAYFSFASSFFVVRTLTAFTAPTIELNEFSSPSAPSSSKRRKLFILGSGVLSLLMSGIILRSSSP